MNVVAGIPDVEDNWADAIISNHALEHCLNPLQELRALLPKLTPGGLAIFVVPCEAIWHTYRPADRNHHLYTWSPMSAGNLFTEAGFEVGVQTYLAAPVFSPIALRSRWQTVVRLRL